MMPCSRSFDAYASWHLWPLAAVSAILLDDGDAGPALDVTVAGLPAWLAVHAKLCAWQEGWDDASRVACAFAAIRAAEKI
jgi:hypothetical protein